MFCLLLIDRGGTGAMEYCDCGTGRIINGFHKIPAEQAELRRKKL